MTLRQNIYLILGIVNVALGTAGIFIPLLPTTPFLLLAAFLFARSSRRWHDWLLSHRRLGPYIHAFRGKTGLTRSQKTRIIASITVVMWTSAYFAPLPGIKAMLVVMWAFWTALILRMKTAAEPLSYHTDTSAIPRGEYIDPEPQGDSQATPAPKVSDAL